MSLTIGNNFSFVFKHNLMFWPRIYVQSLVNRVSGANHQSFHTEAAAQAHYTDNAGRAEVVRTSRQDDITFGPLDEALHVNWVGEQN